MCFVFFTKVDLVKHDQAILQHEQIRKFVAGTVADEAPVIPISAVLKYNIDVVCEYIHCKIPIPGKRRAAAREGLTLSLCFPADVRRLGINLSWFQLWWKKASEMCVSAELIKLELKNVIWRFWLCVLCYLCVFVPGGCFSCFKTNMYKN